MTAPIKQQIANVLAEHRYMHLNAGHRTGCRGCTWQTASRVGSPQARSEHEAHVAAHLAALFDQPETSGIEYGLAVARDLLQKVADYWEGRPCTHHGDHIMADLHEANSYGGGWKLDLAVETLLARVAAETRESVLDEAEQGIMTLTHSALPGSGYARGLVAGQNVVRDLRGGGER